jgi:hypothetical protein
VVDALLLHLLLMAAPESGITRRVCVVQGVDTYSAPALTRRVTRPRRSMPLALEAGTYVTLTGQRADGFVRVRTLGGATVWVREQTAAGRSTLCVPASIPMTTCGGIRGAVPILRDTDARSARKPVGLLRQGALVRSWEYFEDRGRWAFIEREGRVGFVPSRTLCPVASAPPDTDASDRFSMTPAPAGAECYQSQRSRAASEIRRIVIHNSEQPLASVISTFQRCNPRRPTSAHVAIDRDGRLYRFVEDRHAAFHTGAADGGMNAISLGIEVIAGASPDQRGMTPVQERALLDLVRFWSRKYDIDTTPEVIANSTQAPAYADIEYWDAAVTVHRFVSAGRGTDCPKYLWDDSPAGDEAFFEWRRLHFGARPAGQ